MAYAETFCDPWTDVSHDQQSGQLSGTCARCGHTTATNRGQVWVGGAAPADLAPDRVAGVAAKDIVICACVDSHPGAPEGGCGCGGYWWDSTPWRQG